MKKGVFNHKSGLRSAWSFKNKHLTGTTYFHLGCFNSENKAHSAYLQTKDMISLGLTIEQAIPLIKNENNTPISFIQNRLDSVDLELTKHSIYLSTHKNNEACQLIGIELKHLDLLIDSLVEIKNKLTLTE